MIKKLVLAFKDLIKLESLKLIDFSLSLLKGVAIKLEFFEKDKDKDK